MVKLTKTMNKQSKAIERLKKRETPESDFIGALKEKESQMISRLDHEVESIEKLEAKQSLNNSEWNTPESDSETDLQERRKMHESLDRITQNSTFFNERSVD